MPGVPRHVAGNLAPLLAHRRRVKEVNQRSFLRRAVAHGTQNTRIWMASMMTEIERRSAPNGGNARLFSAEFHHGA
jgi:hypothetical protein